MKQASSLAEIKLSDFSALPQPPWKNFYNAQAKLAPTGTSLLFVNQKTSNKAYTNAQLDDYQGLPRHKFRWQAPLTLTVQARFSHPAGQLRGTTGFGFWNDPFMMTGWRWPSLPQALWFFYASPPSNMKLDLQAPGFGWKAATINAWSWPFLALAPLAPVAMPLMRFSWLYRLCWPLGQRAIQVNEQPLRTDMTTWHTYKLTWLNKRVLFYVDEKLVLDCAAHINGPLGFVLWLDNQYMIITPWGRLGYGLLETPHRQWLEISALSITPL